MIKQNSVGLKTRQNANPYYEDGFLPLITSNMFSVVDENNFNVFLKHKINVALPRESKIIESKNVWNSLSIDIFEKLFINDKYEFNNLNIIIDCANGNNPKLHEVIKLAKQKYGDNLKIMSGNVSNKYSFLQLAKSGCDYIRVGVGGSLACNTTKNTGVGQKNLGKLIKKCYFLREQNDELKHVKIVADGISSYIDLCVNKYGYLNNGYATINKLLHLGSDYVMIGKLFAQSFESAGEKINQSIGQYPTKVVYQGMSTKNAQSKYNNILKHSEGSTNLIDVKWTLNEWLNGSDDEPDYLPGFINCLKSAMAYTGDKEIINFIKENI
jgi:hypothetical protein